MSFTDRLREEIEYSGLLHKEIADKAGIKKRAFDMYVGAQSSMPPADIAVRIAEVLGVSVEYLVTGKEKPSEPALTPKTKKLLNLLAPLDENQKDALIHLIEAFAKNL